MFYTADASQVGKTLKDGATANATTDSATAHAFTAQNTDGWYAGTGDYETNGKYVTASAHDTTNDDGYYIDIPIWLRTSSTATPSVYVTGYVKKGTGTSDTDGDELYKAVRVAVLDSSGVAAGGVLDLTDGSAYPATQAAITSILDSDIPNTNLSTSGIVAMKQSGTISASSYEAVTVNKGATPIGTLTAKAANATSQYAAGTKFIIRVWLEGDDINCWNANAGQDWDISLKFMTSALPEGTGGNNNNNNNEEHPNKTYTITVKTNAADESGTTYTYTSTWNGTAYSDWTSDTALPTGTYYTAKDTTYTLPSTMSEGSITVYTNNPTE